MSKSRLPHDRTAIDFPNVKTEKEKNERSLTSRNLQSCFQLAKMIVTKVEQIDQEKRYTILVADDEPLTFELINEFFSEANLHYKILRAETGRSAYQLAVTELPDLIITDWIMPEFDGPDLIKKLKANEATRDIPVILTTGAVFPDNEFSRVLATGAIDYIRKPIDERELMASVKTSLALTESFREANDCKDSIQIKNQILNFLMEVAPNPIFYLDRMGCLLGCNEIFENMVDQRRADLLGKTVYEFFPETFAIELEAKFVSLKKLGEVSRCELELVDRKDRIKNYVLSYVGFGSSEIEVIIGSLFDNTEIVQARKHSMAKQSDGEEKPEPQSQELAERQGIIAQLELLFHSRKVKSDLVDAIRKLLPFLTESEQTKFVTLTKQLHWELSDERKLSLEEKFDLLNSEFYELLEKKCNGLTKHEKRLCTYLKMSYGVADIANITGNSLANVDENMDAVKSKLGLQSDDDLRTFIDQLEALARHF